MPDRICVSSARKPGKASRVVHGGEMILQVHLARHQSGEPLPDIPDGTSMLIYNKMLGYGVGFISDDSHIFMEDDYNHMDRADDFWYCVLPDPEVFTDA